LVRGGYAASELTDLAVFLAGHKRDALREEWRAHLAGESSYEAAIWRNVKRACGFLVSAVRYRCSDATDATWIFVGAVLRSRTLSNVVVIVPTAAATYLVPQHEETLGVVTSAESMGMIGGTLYGLIRTGRWWRTLSLQSRRPAGGRNREHVSCGTEEHRTR
jgi:hypothetical protein